MDHPAPTAGLPAGRPVALDDRVTLCKDASVVLGGAPWRVLRIAPAGRPFLRRLAAAAGAGVEPSPGVEQALADLLSARGIVHPVAPPHPGEARLDVIVPAFERPHLLERCLVALRETVPGARLIVVDDASADDRVAEVARAHGAVVVRHRINRGPAAARNTGLREATSPIVAFVDADCAVTPGWTGPLLAHFDDPRVVAVAPRIRSRTTSTGILARYEDARSALDMGPHPELVTPGAALGYVPSAVLLARRSALGDQAFDEQLRLGEDVDLIWRLAQTGGLIRYEPASVATHEMRPDPGAWARQVFGYGTSAADLERRHPRTLAPARLSSWNLVGAVALLARRPALAVRAPASLTVAGAAVADVARQLRASSVDQTLAPLIAGKRLLSDTAAAGHLLRREWWPIGWLALGCAPRSRWARAAAAAMLVPLVAEWRRNRPRLGFPAYLGLRLAEDAVYGSGVIAGAVRSRCAGVLLPVVRVPRGDPQKKPTALSL